MWESTVGFFLSLDNERSLEYCVFSYNYILEICIVLQELCIYRPSVSDIYFLKTTIIYIELKFTEKVSLC